MNEPLKSTAPAVALRDLNPQSQIDALQNGAWTEAQFIHEVLLLPESIWTVISLVDQRYRRGLLPEQIFRSIKSKLARGAVEQSEYAKTVELNPPASATTSTPAHATDSTPAHMPIAMSKDCQSRREETKQAAGASNPPSREPMSSGASSTSASDGSHLPAHRPHGLLADRYSLESVLGRGGMGTVYKASDRHRADLPPTSRHVALKMLNANIMARSGALADLRREFYCAQALSHPNIVKVYELQFEEQPPFYTMELLEGCLLSDLIERQQPEPLERQYALAIIRDVGAALVHAHSRGVVHGDLKPHNIMITDANDVRILDFGASAAITRQLATSDALQRSRASAVTLAYTCCELLDGLQTDPRDDLYALACVAFEMLAGKHPFDRLSATEARDIGMRPARPPGLTDRQWRALDSGLSWRREDRSVSVRDWLKLFRLEPVSERLPSLLPHEAKRTPPSARSWMPNSTQVAAAALVLTLIAGFSAWTVERSKYSKAVARHLPAHETPANMPGSTSGTPSDPARSADTAPSTATASADNDAKPAPAESARSEIPESPTLDSAAHAASFGGAQGATENRITLTANTYRVPSGEAFAEILVWRSNGTLSDGSFEWWTEPASANSGRDFVAQGRTKHLFLNGRHLARLYIRIVPNQARIHSEKFYVDIGEPGAGYSLGAVTRAAIVIPPILTALR